MKIQMLIFCALIAGCAEFPALDGTIDAEARDAPFPKLENIAELRNLTADGATTEDEIAALQARIARLNARANALRERQ